jgi:hypothetical protein
MTETTSQVDPLKELVGKHIDTWDVASAFLFPDDADRRIDRLLLRDEEIDMLGRALDSLTARERAWLLLSACYRGKPLMDFARACDDNPLAADFLGSFFVLSHNAGWRRTTLRIAGAMTAMTPETKQRLRARIETWLQHGNALRGYEIAALEAGWTTLESVSQIIERHPDLPLPEVHKESVRKSLGLSKNNDGTLPFG